MSKMTLNIGNELSNGLKLIKDHHQAEGDALIEEMKQDLRELHLETGEEFRMEIRKPDGTVIIFCSDNFNSIFALNANADDAQLNAPPPAIEEDAGEQSISQKTRGKTAKSASAKPKKKRGKTSAKPLLKSKQKRGSAGKSK